MKHLHKAIADYPRFVSAHVGLGLACVDQEDAVCAKSEFEAAAKLDDRFAGSFLHLGQLALSLNDFGKKAASLSPTDARVLSRLAYAQHGAHEFWHALETVPRIHALDHKGMANVHYVAASAALALNDLDTMERELGFFIGEDPTNAFAPIARQNLDALTRNKAVRTADKLHELIRSRYFIAYKPADFQPNGNYRSISIIAKQDGKTLRVRARKGYHARLETSHN